MRYHWGLGVGHFYTRIQNEGIVGATKELIDGHTADLRSIPEPVPESATQTTGGGVQLGESQQLLPEITLDPVHPSTRQDKECVQDVDQSRSHARESCSIMLDVGGKPPRSEPCGGEEITLRGAFPMASSGPHHHLQEHQAFPAPPTHPGNSESRAVSEAEPMQVSNLNDWDDRASVYLGDSGAEDDINPEDELPNEYEHYELMEDMYYGDVEVDMPGMYTSYD